MKKPSILERRTEVYKQHHKYFDVCIELLEYSEDNIVSINEALRTQELDINYKKLLILLFTRNTSTFRGTIILCAYGQQTDAHCLLRTMVESYINLKYIQTNREPLAKRFLEYGFMNVYQFFEKASREHPEQFLPLLEWFNAQPNWKEKYLELKTVYPQDQRNWSDKNVREMAEKSNNLDIYPTYRFLSESLHTSLSSLGSNISGSEGTQRIELYEDTRTIYFTLDLAFKAYYNILCEIRNEFGIKQSEELEQIVRKFLQIPKEHNKS